MAGLEQTRVQALEAQVTQLGAELSHAEEDMRRLAEEKAEIIGKVELMIGRDADDSGEEFPLRLLLRSERERLVRVETQNEQLAAQLYAQPGPELARLHDEVEEWRSTCSQLQHDMARAASTQYEVAYEVVRMRDAQTVDDATTNLGRTRHEAATLRKALQKSRGEKEQLQRQLAKMDREMTALKQPKPAAAPKSDAAPAASLSAAVRSGDLDQVELQLSIGANPNEQDTKGLSPLMVATVAGATELMSLLLATKADVQAADPQYGMTALHVAANAGRDHAVRLLLEHAADVSALTKSEETALHRAARRGHLACVQALLRAGCDPLGKTRHGTSALSLADEHHANAVGYRERKHAAAVVGLLLSPEGVEVTAARRKLRVPEVARLSATARPQPPVGVRPRRPTSANDATKSSPRSGKQLQPSDDSAGLEVRRAKLENTRLLRKLQQSQAA